MRFFKSIKFRLTVWYLLVIIGMLLVLGSAAYFMLANNLKNNLDNSLKTRGTELQFTLRTQMGRTVIVERLNELVLIYSSSGNLVQKLGPNVELNNIDDLVKQTLAGQSLFATTTTSDGQEVRLYTVSFNFMMPANRFALIIGQPTSPIQQVLYNFRSVLRFTGIGVFILAGIGGFLLASRALKPVDRITRTAQQIGESDLSRRLPVESGDELGRLAATLNGMIGRLEAAFSRQRQFTADASHELRTPLAVIQAESTLALSKERSEAEYRKSLEVVTQESTYMSSVIGKLLFLARSDAGKEQFNFETVNLKELLAQLAPDMEVLARDKVLQFNIGPLENVAVKGDKVKLRQLFVNLLENAIRYTPGGGSISSSLVLNDGSALVTISDTGIGIEPEHLPHIFERFYRIDKARSRVEGGVGLGLSIVQYITEVHGGKIEVESQPGKGTSFRVHLPLADTEREI